MYSRFWGIFWIDGRSETSITNGFASIARKCGHHDESHEGVLLWLQNTSHSWLLILDNADNKDLDMAQFLPAEGNGSILITTRLIECAKHQTAGKDRYEKLNQETAINLLLKACDIELSLRSDYEDDARAVAELLGCHALAVIQAGAAISQNLCSLAEYKIIFRDQRQGLLECFPEQAKSEYGGVYATFEVSATYLKARNDQKAKDALQLLNFYAFMHFSEFPEIAFEEAWKNSRNEAIVSSRLLPDGEKDIESLAPWHVTHLPTFMQMNTHDINLDKLRLRNARSMLVSLSLVIFDAARGMTRMHPVSHFWSKDRLQEQPEESTNARLNGLSVLSLSIEDPYTLDVFPLSSQLQSHIESIAHSLKAWECPKHDFHFQQSLFRLGYVMYRMSCDSALFEILQIILTQNDESWLRTRNGQKIQLLHSRYAQMYGDANMAVKLLEKLSGVQLQTLPAEDPSCLQSQHDLAVAYLRTGDMTKAIASLERLVHIRTKTLSPEHYDRLNSQHALAGAYRKIGETAKAIAMLEEVVEIKNKTQRPEHPHRLASQQVLASAYLGIGETAKATAMLEEVIKIENETLRPEHSDRLASQHELARAYLAIGETAKAIALLESVVEIRAQTLRADHPDRVVSIYLLAQCHYHARNSERALELARSIESVAQNGRGEKIADWNAEMIIELAKTT